MKKMPKLTSIHCLALMSILVSCGGSRGGGTKASLNISSAPQRQPDQGIYRAILSPLNKSVAGEAIGTVEIRIEGDEVLIESNVTGTHPGVKHFQHVMTGGECPGDAMDANQDLVIDIKEAQPVTGKILIPIDADLSEQLSGMDYGPISNSSGSFVYRRSTTLSHLLSDLRMPDPDVLDPVLKLAPEADLNLAGKPVLIYGVSSDTVLPPTVSNLAHRPAHLSLPVACGVLGRVTKE